MDRCGMRGMLSAASMGCLDDQDGSSGYCGSSDLNQQGNALALCRWTRRERLHLGFVCYVNAGCSTSSPWETYRLSSSRERILWHWTTVAIVCAMAHGRDKTFKAQTIRDSNGHVISVLNSGEQRVMLGCVCVRGNVDGTEAVKVYSAPSAKDSLVHSLVGEAIV